MLLHLEKRGCGTHLLCRLPLCTNVYPKCTSLCFVDLAVHRTVARQKIMSKTCYTSDECQLPSHGRCAMPVLYAVLETNGLQCLYSMLCLKQMVCNACTICYAWNKWCAIIIAFVLFEMNGVQCLCYMLYLKWVLCNDCTMCYVWNEWCAMCVLCIAYTLIFRQMFAHVLFMYL